MVNNKALSKKVLFSCFLASCLEIYDFAIFGFFTSILHANYLSFIDEKTATIAAYAFFAVGFVFRPLGALIFGYIGDVKGRKVALVTSVSLMGMASLIMFILPPYSMIGVLSCYIIVLVRIIQGISVGGEFTGAIIFAVEHNEKKVAGLVAGIISAGGACGVLLASFVSRFLQQPTLPEYSWRFAFLLGFGLSVIGYFIRKKLSDTPVFKKKTLKRIPLLEGLKSFKTESFATVWVAAANGATFYFGTVYLGRFIQEVRSDYDFSFVPILVSLTVGCLLPIFGMISDKINRKLFLLGSSFLMGTYSLFSIDLIIGAESINMIYVWILLCFLSCHDDWIY